MIHYYLLSRIPSFTSGIKRSYGHHYHCKNLSTVSADKKKANLVPSML